jgi:dipeptidase
MCDTMIALGNATADGTVILAKNSDREPNEAHWLHFVPGAEHAPGERVECTYIDVPQVETTHAVLLSRPFWMWGCEMGINEHGVTIGNEAVFTREPYDKAGGLLGMDLMRLGLERAATAEAALDVIVELLAAHGQGGNGGYEHNLFYHNAFIIADPAGAWVLETAGRYWAAVRVRDVYAISNGLTIGREWDRASPDLVEHAIERGWCASADDFHFARCYSDPIYTRLSQCKRRRARALSLLQADQGEITVRTMMRALRDHGPEAAKQDAWGPAQGSTGNVCMHAGFGPLRDSGTTNSWIAHLDPQLLTVWSTATAAPCTALFKPVWPEAMPDLGPAPGAAYDPSSIWWQHERLHRAVLRDYPTRLARYRKQRDALENKLMAEAGACIAETRSLTPEARRETLKSFSADAFQRGRQATSRWIEAVEAEPVGFQLPTPYRLAWQQRNRKAGIANDR